MVTHECVLCGKRGNRFLVSLVEGYNPLTREQDTQYFCRVHDNPFQRLAARDRKKTKLTKAQRRKRQLQTYQRTVKRQSEEIAVLKGKLGTANQIVDSYDRLGSRLLDDVNKYSEQAQDRKKFIEALAVVFPATKERIDAFLEPPGTTRLRFGVYNPYYTPKYTLERLAKLRKRIKL